MNTELLLKVFKAQKNGGYTPTDSNEIVKLNTLEKQGMISYNQISGCWSVTDAGGIEVCADHDIDLLCGQIKYLDGDETEKVLQSLINVFENKELTNYNRRAIIYGLKSVLAMVNGRTSN